MLKIFEVKVYPYSPEMFDRKVNKKIGEALGKNPNYPPSLMHRFYRSKSNFEDYSIGHIDVLLNGAKIVYVARLMISERYDSKYIAEKLEQLKTLGLSEREYLIKKNEISSSHENIAYKPHLFTNTKRYTQDWPIDNSTSHHIYNMSNKEIIKQIKKMLCDINSMDFYKKLYFDLSEIDRIGDCLDFAKLIEKSRRKTNG